ncbi:MAG UNVERIFIED_CONTAM: tyrosyl-DNA phosphodiesterase 1 [Microcystis novacekii LVE1205-3]
MGDRDSGKYRIMNYELGVGKWGSGEFQLKP